MDFSNKTIAIGICGGIAAYRVYDLIRELYRRGAARVLTLTTEHAEAFISPLTLQALSRHPVMADPLATNEAGVPWHIALAQEADALLIMPATANMLAKLAHGMADDMVSTTAISFTDKPVLIAPAMNTRMWNHPLTQGNRATLQTLPFVQFVEPSTGELACGEYGAGHIAESESILQALYTQLHPNPGILSGVRALVTAGGTREAIDPVRYITNRSSGKMGIALADELHAMGATVTLLFTEPTALAKPYTVIETPTVATMDHQLQAHFPQSDVLLMAAAVSDFRVTQPSQHKLKKAELMTSSDTSDASAGTTQEIPLTLAPNPDLLSQMAQHKTPKQVVVGFAAESQELSRHALDKLQRKNLDMIVANDIARPDIGFQADQNEVTLFFKDGTSQFIPRQPKWSIARHIIEALVHHHPALATKPLEEPSAPMTSPQP